eukprot:3053416-Heterocapsa_arctica.AAC.1
MFLHTSPRRQRPHVRGERVVSQEVAVSVQLDGEQGGGPVGQDLGLAPLGGEPLGVAEAVKARPGAELGARWFHHEH